MWMQYRKTIVKFQNQIFIVSFYIFSMQVILFQCLALCVPRMYQTNYACLITTLKHQELCLLSMRVTTTVSDSQNFVKFVDLYAVARCNEAQ